jgi:two-component system response regulator DevR
MEKVKVFLSDPQVLFREGIHFILSGEEDFEVIGETTSNDEAYTLIEANPPNIAVLSLLDRKTSGPEITRRIRRGLPSVSVILTIDKKDDEKIFDAIRSGASACLTKDTDPEQLLETIRVVSEGSLPIAAELTSPGVAAMVLAEFENLTELNQHMDNLLAHLTAKEKQVLESIAGVGAAEPAAVKPAINGDTASRHLRLILNKLVANDQAQAVIEAAQRSLPTVIRRPLTKAGGRDAEYVTRAEFNEFKDHLMERLKSLLGELA